MYSQYRGIIHRSVERYEVPCDHSESDTRDDIGDEMKFSLGGMKVRVYCKTCNRTYVKASEKIKALATHCLKIEMKESD